MLGVIEALGSFPAKTAMTAMVRRFALLTFMDNVGIPFTPLRVVHPKAKSACCLLVGWVNHRCTQVP